MDIKDRIGLLRESMANAGIQAYIINGADPHLSEYVPTKWKTREWISGFTGSYGQVIVTLKKAALWTDSRYFIQAEKELTNTGIELVRDRIPNAVTKEEWLSKELNSGDKVGVDESCLSLSEFKGLNSKLNNYEIAIQPVGDLLEEIWTGRPAFPSFPVFELSENYTGASRADKVDRIRHEMQKEKAEVLLISALDELCWTYNLRGEDIQYNPVFMGFGIVTLEKSILFVNAAKITVELKGKLEKEGVELLEYIQFYSFLQTIEPESKVWLNPAKINLKSFNSLPKGIQSIEKITPADQLKAIKNEVEINAMKRAHHKDGVAMVHFLNWLQKSIKSGEISEQTVANKLREFRSRQNDFKGESFNSIVGYNEHGAIVHYAVTEESDIPLKPEGFLLIDSGGQYLGGTTDITRTIALGQVSYKMKYDFTLVLKGMINLSLAIFPVGTKGANLDILARQALWNEGLNYGHGTGHGVGAFLNVHEGPMSIRQEYNDIAIQPGMILSNEPGLYREGEYGIRTENLICCKNWKDTDFGSFLEFETLTLCPIDCNAILPELLTENERDWLNRYHKKIFEELSPMLNEEMSEFLAEITRPL